MHTHTAVCLLLLGIPSGGFQEDRRAAEGGGVPPSCPWFCSMSSSDSKEVSSLEQEPGSGFLEGGGGRRAAGGRLLKGWEVSEALGLGIRGVGMAAG